MVQVHPWKADIYSADQEIITISQKQPLNPILSHWNPGHTSTLCIPEIHLNTILPSTSSSPNGLLP